MMNKIIIFKQSRFISKNYDFEKIILLGIWKKGLTKNQSFYNKIQIYIISLFEIYLRTIQFSYYFIYTFIKKYIKAERVIYQSFDAVNLK